MRFSVSVRRPVTGFSLLIISIFITFTESRLEPYKTNNKRETEVVTEEIAITNHAIDMDIEASKEKNEDRTHVLTVGPITGNTVTKKLNKRHVTEETRDIISEVSRLEELLTFNPKREISFRVPPRKTVKEVPKQDRTQELIKLEEEEEEESRSEDAEKEPTKGNTTIVNETTEKTDVIRQLTEEEFEAVTTKNCSLAVMDDDSGPTDPGLASFPCKIALWFHGEFPKWIKTSNLVENLKLLSDEELDEVAETVCVCNIIDIGDFCSTEVKMEAQRIIDRCPRNTITTRLYRVAESYFQQDANLYYGDK